MRKFALVVPFLLTAALPAVTAANPPDIAATEPLPDGLPAADDVRRVLDAHPKVVAWQGRVAAARAQARGLEKGPHELTLSGGMDRREVDREGRFSEYNATLSRAVRLPGKARLDREIGRFGVVAAENLAEDARHQIALQLNGYWWDWLGAAAQAEVDRQAVTNYERSLAALGRRVALRDAAQLDVDQAAAALAAARTLAEQSAGRATVARSRLAAQFPTL
ncbi:MAG: TolC family protein, partial [Novosphingobium sp.]